MSRCEQNKLELMKLDGLPFKLGTTSFIYPDRIVPNVRKLGSFFDEIELLIFESRPFVQDGTVHDVLPTREEINELAALALQYNLTYNVHLPVDITLTDRSERERGLAVDTVKKVVELCAPLQPTTHTLHLDFSDGEVWGAFGKDEKSAPGTNQHQPNEGDQKGLDEWRERALDSLTALADTLDDPAGISIETLHYPFEFLDGIIESCGMSVCVDAGHLIKYGYGIHRIFETYGGRIPLMHLHGVEFPSQSDAVFSSLPSSEIRHEASSSPSPKTLQKPKDHQSLDKTPIERLNPTLDVLKHFNGAVSLEVFKYEDLASSLKYLHSLQISGQFS